MADVEQELSVEEIKKEIIKCGKNPTYFLKHYAKIIHTDRGTIPFKTYKFQDEFLDNVRDHRFNIIVKARQLGISTICAGYIAWLMLFYKNKNILIMSTKYNTASNMVKTVKFIINNIPEWLKIGTVAVNNKHSFELSNGSQVKAIPTSPDAGRSEAVSLLVIDEAAHIENMDDIWAAIYPTISTGGRCIALSSPNGIGNWFHRMYDDAENGQNLFIPTNLPWNVHPERDQEWFENETKNMPKRKIAQEYLCDFLSSGETVIDSDDIQWLESNVTEPKYKSWIDRNYHIWKPHNHQGKYLLVADVARGDGDDYSVFHVLNVSTMEQVAEYQGKCEPDQFAKLIFDVGKEYGNALVVIETNNIGFAVATKLAEMQYNNLYWSNKTTHEYVEPIMAYGNSSVVPGFITSVKTRPLIIAKLDELIRNKALHINSMRTIRELKRFIWHNGKPEAQKGYNDDLVLALSIACWIRDTTLINNQKDVGYTQALVNAMAKSSATLNTTINGMTNNRHLEIDNGKKMYKDFLWLIKG